PPADLRTHDHHGATQGGSHHVGEIRVEDWEWIPRINLWGVIHGCHVFVPKMKAQRGGFILNVASSSAIALEEPSPGHAVVEQPTEFAIVRIWNPVALPIESPRSWTSHEQEDSSHHRRQRGPWPGDGGMHRIKSRAAGRDRLSVAGARHKHRVLDRRAH